MRGCGDAARSRAHEHTEAGTAGCVAAGVQDPGRAGITLFAALQRMINRGLEAEMDAHLGYGHGERSEASN